MKQKLTAQAVKAIEPAARDLICWDTEISGFGMKVTPAGKRSFFLAYRLAGVQRKPKIGDYPAIKPEQARRIAQEWAAQVAAGRDPSGERKAARARHNVDTVVQLFDLYQKDRKSLKSLKEVVRIFNKDVLPSIGRMRAEDVSRVDVNRILDRILQRSKTSALRARQAMSAFYDWALPRLPDAAVNPVTNAIKIKPEEARERALTDEELRALWSVLEKEQEPWQTALRILILTGQRRGEVFDAAWSEFDLIEKLWTIPAERAKNGKAHVVPLAPQVLDLLQALPRNGSVFLRKEGVATFMKLTGRGEREVAGARWQEIDLAKGVWRLSKKRADDRKAIEVALSDEAKTFLSGLSSAGMLFPGSSRNYKHAAKRIRQVLNKALGRTVPAWIWHDLRRTCATGMQRLGVQLVVTEAVLNHVSGSRAGIVKVYQRYDYLDEKRAALEAWANEVLGEKTVGKVVMFQKKRG